MGVGELEVAGLHLVGEERYLLLHGAVFSKKPLNNSYGMKSGGMIAIETFSDGL